FSVITYFAIEKPLRFGKRFRRAKTVGLVAAMLAVGIFGYFVAEKKGLNAEKVIAGRTIDGGWSEWARKKYGLQNSWKEYGGEKPLAADSFFVDCNSEKTVALVGDSHAQQYFPAMARANRENGVNTLLFAEPGAPMVLDGEQYLLRYHKNADRRAHYRSDYRGIFDFLANRQDVRKVFLSITKLPANDIRYMQNTVDFLTAAGKEVYVLMDNPSFDFNPTDYLSRAPTGFLFPAKKMPVVPRAEIEKRMSAYLKIMAEIKGATLLESLDIFCPQGQNLWFDGNGDLLYFDSNHLSLAGGEYRVQKQLAKYLKFPAEE
ncbi:MAG: hypothetical protein LBP75_11410, partial [Planctomycetota bacterium]|nr:hypothetical protein [Planctomycetota bacterium]